ncbi:DsbA family oxidoreductase [Demequina sp. B12]|uniref:DsbA family oxidoreductase n=1 Tax=Demequina sp. B12 TaxID=2992757 RepID=UPI00237AEEE0|nr:DsbA family oxidoreductase [Demequina sp. B12]MDE0572207.1 DsbA family oxidoreductase [Demequina sp. B12]
MTSESLPAQTTAPAPVTVDVWADIVCPFCYIGEARLRKAADPAVVIHPRAFQLNPDGGERESVMSYLARKFGSTEEQVRESQQRIVDLARAEGLPFTNDRVVGDTMNSHRLVLAALGEGGPALALDVREAIQRGHFGGTLDITDADALVDTAVKVGLDVDLARAAIDNDDLAQLVRAEHQQASQMGATGVPFTVVGERFGIPGMVETDQYAEVIARVREAH